MQRRGSRALLCPEAHIITVIIDALLLSMTFIVPGFFALQALYPYYGEIGGRMDMVYRAPLWVMMSILLNLPMLLVFATPRIGMLKAPYVLAYQISLSLTLAYFAWRRNGLWPIFLGRYLRELGPVRNPVSQGMAVLASEIIFALRKGDDARASRLIRIMEVLQK